MPFHVQPGDLRTAIEIMSQIPEMGTPLPYEEYEKRIQGLPQIILIAWVDEEPAGFKIGYQRDNYFYSWLGGVKPEFRRQGIARSLAIAQEAWAREQGYDSIAFKTRNRFKAMLTFALNNGFFITAVEPKPDPMETRIELQKLL